MRHGFGDQHKEVGNILKEIPLSRGEMFHNTPPPKNEGKIHLYLEDQCCDLPRLETKRRLQRQLRVSLSNLAIGLHGTA